jgi:hypothetical protein
VQNCKTFLKNHNNYKIVFSRCKANESAHILARAALSHASCTTFDVISSCIVHIIINEMVLVLLVSKKNYCIYVAINICYFQFFKNYFVSLHTTIVKYIKKNFIRASTGIKTSCIQTLLETCTTFSTLFCYSVTCDIFFYTAT